MTDVRLHVHHRVKPLSIPAGWLCSKLRDSISCDVDFCRSFSVLWVIYFIRCMFVCDSHVCVDCSDVLVY